MLARLQKSVRPLLITTPDRVDTLTTAVAAHSSGFVPLSGALLHQPASVASNNSPTSVIRSGCCLVEVCMMPTAC